MNAKLFCVIVGFCAFIVAFVLGSAVTLTTGIPLAGGLLNGVLTSMIMTIGMLATRNKYKWSGTVMWLVFSAAAIITTTLGPPGFYKVIIGVAAGFTWDLFYRAFKYGRTGLYIGALIGGIVITGLLILILQLMISGMASHLSIGGSDYKNSLDRLMSYIKFLIPINMVITAIGIWLGERVFEKRLKEVLKVN
jgi:hypothetical protein